MRKKRTPAISLIALARLSAVLGLGPLYAQTPAPPNPDFSAFEKKYAWVAARELVADFSTKRAPLNFEESKVKPYTLPDVLAGAKTIAEWKDRRNSLLEIFRTEVYGSGPPRPDNLRFRVIDSDANAMNGAATRKRVEVWFALEGEAFPFTITMFVPNRRSGKAPVFLLLNHRGRNNTDPSRKVQSAFWPAEYAASRGYAMAAVDVSAEVEPDDARAVTGLRAFYRKHTAVAGRWTWGALSAWAWAGSRAVDYLVTDNDIDAAKIAVIGHSRGGKTSLWMGAQDERVALTCVNSSGQGGVSLMRRNFGEDTAALNRAFPHWMTENYKKYSARAEDPPFDQHQLLALVAPRGLSIGASTLDLWADPRGAWLSMREASRVYALHRRARPLDDAMPLVNENVIDDALGFHLREGAHDLTTFDWKCYLDHADSLWGRRR